MEGGREGGGGGKERWKEGEVKGRWEEERLLCMFLSAGMSLELGSNCITTATRFTLREDFLP